MFLIRAATFDDAPTLLKLAKMVHFINLPADPEIIRTRILRSRKSFVGEPDTPLEREFVFVLEDTGTGNVVGTSSIISCAGHERRPHTFLQVRKRELYSTDLQSGQVHLTLQLGTDSSNPSEIGGLVLGPSYRGHVDKLGMVLSLVRFHFIGMHREWFADRIIAEMMGPMEPDGRNLFWEHFGRCFINLSFAEADLFCQRSKEFITSLFPKVEIYATMLPAAARSVIGRVGAETEPAKSMLEGIGFVYNGHIDPFDGGPYIEAQTGDIQLVRATQEATVAAPRDDYPGHGFVSVHKRASFRAVRSPIAVIGGELSIPAEVAKTLEVEPGDTVWVTPLERSPRSESHTSTSQAHAPARAPATPPEAVS